MTKLSGESWLALVTGRGRKKAAAEREKTATIGVLTFEMASLMSKAVHLWHSLADEQIAKLRDEVLRLEGVRKLVSDDDDFLLGLALAEIMETVDALSRSVGRLGKRCADPVLQRFENVFADLIKNESDLYGLQYAGKKMERKVKKMERFIRAGAKLYQELEVLAEMEQVLRRMQGNPATRRQGISLVDFKQKVVCERQAVKCLREISVWNRTFDYIVRLLARSLFTIVARIKLVFGFHQKNADTHPKSMTQHLSRSYSVSGLLHSPVHPSDGGGRINRFASGPILIASMKSGPISLNHRVSGVRRRGTKWPVSRQPFKGCVAGGDSSSVLQSCVPIDSSSSGIHNASSSLKEEDHRDPQESIFSANVTLGIFKSRRKLLNAPPSTLAAAALALHYANVIIVIEKLATFPHLISDDARDDLYNMLPWSIRKALRMRLKSYAKNLASPVYDPDLAEEWTEAMTRILEWLAPLAHNMIKWQSDRNFEQQNLVSSTNLLLLQTLYYANQAKTEAVITELLVGLNYLWRFEKELNAKAMHQCVSSRNSDDYSQT
ncbi:hypothetical protein AXF42_Ash011840 [Apostasia shenzhenica]|uniref:DUF668 domain-containing protein n=1 Tax=Apostasia shenzhenica TaxID=1088818 RepID=A0A2I0AW20_9ASPA|nr:hypothetical protein AXF42_Ash011840 [Apostasia shenzhenica]